MIKPLKSIFRKGGLFPNRYPQTAAAVVRPPCAQAAFHASCATPLSGAATGYAFVILVFCLLVFMPPAAGCQETIILAYQQNFARSSLAAKAELLTDAATDEQAGVFMGPLYNFALDFVLQNEALLGDDPQMINLAVIAARGAGKSGYSGSVTNLWGVFSNYRDPLVRVEVLNALGELGNGDVCAYLNQYLLEQNKLRRTRTDADLPVVSACINALGKLKDGSSFLPVFGAMIENYSPSISAEAAAVLNSLPGDYAQFLIDVIHANAPAEKLAAFRAGIDNSRLSPAEQGRLAENAMEAALRFTPANSGEKALVSTLGYSAAAALTKLQWSEAGSLVIQYFYRVQSDFHQGYASKERFIEALHCLGAMKTSETSAIAILLLGLINAQTERSGIYDADVTLALVGILGDSGDKSAFDHLLYTSNLPYTDSIKAAAREAIDRLR